MAKEYFVIPLKAADSGAEDDLLQLYHQLVALRKHVEKIMQRQTFRQNILLNHLVTISLVLLHDLIFLAHQLSQDHAKLTAPTPQTDSERS